MRKSYVIALFLLLFIMAIIANVAFSTIRMEDVEKLKRLRSRLLEEVAGFNLSKYYLGFERVGAHTEGQHIEVWMTGRMFSVDENFFVSITLYDWKFLHYHLDGPSAQRAGNKTINECANVARTALLAYGRLFNVSVCEMYANMIPANVEGNLTVEMITRS